MDKVCSVSRWGQPASAIFTLDSDSATRAVWDHAFKLELTVIVSACIQQLFYFAACLEQFRCRPPKNLIASSLTLRLLQITLHTKQLNVALRVHNTGTTGKKAFGSENH